MTHLSRYENISEIETCYISGNMKVLFCSFSSLKYSRIFERKLGHDTCGVEIKPLTQHFAGSLKHLSSYDNIFETEAWHFWDNMKVLLRDVDLKLCTERTHDDPTGKTIWGLCIVSNVCKWSNFLFKMS